MRVRSFTTSIVAAAVAILAAGCGSVDSPAAPQAVTSAPSAPAAPSHSLLGTLLGVPQIVSPIMRTTPLAAPINVSRTIGLLGGTIVVPGAGLTIVVPPLAVVKNTTFTVTALAGSAVAYNFGPHGQFNLPLIMTQDLRNTSARNGGTINPLGLRLGYFPDNNHITSVTELLTVTVSLPTQTAIATIWHFSGYIWASGRDDSSF